MLHHRTFYCWKLDVYNVIGWIAYVAQLGNIGGVGLLDRKVGAYNISQVEGCCAKIR